MLHHSLLLATVASLTSAAPDVNGGFTVNQQSGSQNPQPLTGTETILKAYFKYARAGAVIPQRLIDAQRQRAQTGTVAATPLANDRSYVAPVTIGGQVLNLNFDTGSSDLWVYSTVTPANESFGHTNRYDPKKSPTSSRLKGQTWNITYADGTGASGIVLTDKVTVGGATVTYQAVEAATHVNDFGGFDNQDGLLGLSFSSINTVRPNQQQTFFDNVKGTLSKKLFTADLRKGEPGSYDFGFLNQQKYTGAVTYTPVDSSQGFWQFQAGGYGVGDSKKVTGNQGPVVADTGTSLLYATSQATFRYYAEIRDVVDVFGLYYYPCAVAPPDFHTSIGGRTFTVPGYLFNYANAGPAFEGDYCLGGIQSNQGLPFSLYGDVFLKAVYAVYDQSQSTPRMGFAVKNFDL